MSVCTFVTIGFPSGVSCLFVFPSFCNGNLMSGARPSSGFSGGVYDPPPNLSSVTPAYSFTIPVTCLVFIPTNVLTVSALSLTPRLLGGTV